MRVSHWPTGTRGQRGAREFILTLDASNHQSCSMIEDLKPAGLEAVEVQSGSSIRARRLSQRAVDRLGQEGFPSDPVVWVAMVRNNNPCIRSGATDKSLCFDELPEGFGNLLHASSRVPGAFHALPAVGKPCIPDPREQP